MGDASRWVPADKLIERYGSAEDHYWARFAPIAGYACPSCGAEFGEEERLGRHRIRVHGGVTMRLTELPHPKRLAEILASGRRVLVTYTSSTECEGLRRAMYHAARRAKVEITMIADGGESGTLHVMPRIAGRCGERRPGRSAPERDYASAVVAGERGDLEAIAELRHMVRRPIAEMREELQR